jgi:HlyD family secretion protein
MKPKTHSYWLIAVGLALAAVLALAFRPQPVPADFVRIERGPLIVTINEEGRTRIKERYIVSAPLSGRVQRLALHPGDTVEAGRTLITAVEPADPELLDPRARALAHARINAAEAARERSVPLLERARTAHEYAATELARSRELYEREGVSHRELDAAEQREAETAAGLKSAEFERRIAEYEYEIARAALVRGDSDNGAGANAGLDIRAPISGRVLRVFQESSTVAQAGARLLEIGDPTDLEIVIEVLSTDAVKIAPGARVNIEHWGGPAPLAARVRVIEPAGFTKISALGVEEQRVNVIADFAGDESSRRAIGDGFRVEARIVIWEDRDVLKVPIGALFREGEAWAIFAAEHGRARLKSVQLGQRNDRDAEVVSGIDAGDEIILHPSDRVTDGVRLAAR